MIARGNWWLLTLGAAGALAVLSTAHCPAARVAATQASKAAAEEKAEPWKSAEVIAPAKLERAVANSKAKKPQIVCVGYETLYRSAHIPGAIYKGPAGGAHGMEELKAWARRTPKSEPIVIYCGCCPMSRCPNVRPAFRALKALGFSNVKVLDIPNDFAADWAAKGYPVARSQ